MSRGISIFARPAYILEDPRHHTGRYLKRVSSRIRGEEIAAYLGARYNPPGDYENDVCIHVKPRTLAGVRSGAWVDVLDGPGVVELLRERSDLGVIAMTWAHEEYLRRELPHHRVVYIPHHHINHERARRVPGRQRLYGFVGSFSLASRALQDELAKRLGDRGLIYKPLLNYERREDVVAYYQTIDVQVFGHLNANHGNVWSAPTRVINAASFGIPTIADPDIPGYRELLGRFWPVTSMDELVEAAVQIQDDECYEGWPEYVAQMAEPYHIERVAALYRSLT